jgi:outer membrane protein TolC
LTLPASGQWTAGDLLSGALKNNPQIAEAAAKARTAQAAVEVARARLAATLTLTAEYSDEASHWLYGVGSDIPLDVGKRRSGRIDQAELAALQSRYDYAEALWAVRTAIARAGADRRRCGDRPGAARGGGRRSARPGARRPCESGRRAQADVALAKALGVSTLAVADLNLAPSPASADLDWRAARERAPLTRTDVLRAVVDYDLAETALRTEVAKQYPEVRIGPGYTYDHGVRKIPFNLTLVLPPLDLNRAAIAQAEAKRAEAGRSLEAIQAAVLAAVDRAASSLTTARDAERLIRDRDLPNARRAAQGAAAAVRAGEGDRVDDLAAQAAVLDAELALLDGRRNIRATVLDLEDAVRTPFDPAERTLLLDSFKRLGANR